MTSPTDQVGTEKHGINQRFSRLIAIVALTGVYFCAGKFGLSLAFVNASASAVWPPTGIALAAMLLWGTRLWPAVFLGAFLVNITTQGSWPTSLGIACGNTLEALLGAWLVRRFAAGTRAFERTANLFRFVGLAAMLSTLPCATLGVTSLCLGGLAQWNHYWNIWLTWWLGDAVSNMIIAPLPLIWMTQGRPRLSPAQILEATGVVLSVLVIGYLLFLGTTALSGANYPLSYLAIPPLLWAAFRCGERGAVTCTILMSGIALWGTRHGFGPFVRSDPNHSLLLLQAYMAISTVTALVVASLVRERRQVEIALRAAHDELAVANTGLEKKVETRTAELREMVAELEHFSYAIVHDLRAPLRSMLGFAELMETQYGETLPAQTREYLQRIKVSSHRMDTLITDALSYSMAVRENLPLVPVDLLSLLRGIAESYPNLQTPRAEIRIEGDLPVVQGNVSALTQCFSNLLGNAVKFVSPGVTPRVRIWAEPSQGNGGPTVGFDSGIQPVIGNNHSAAQSSVPSANSVVVAGKPIGSAPTTSTSEPFVRIWVEDNGIGIAPNWQERIFDMFERINPGYEGTGIGLAIVRKVVHRMGGQVGVESEPGNGSRFWLELKKTS